MKTVHLLVRGKVQGVYYRASAKQVADQLDLRGWVRNTPEGHVEIVASGSGINVDRFIEWCWRGPSSADVKEVMENKWTEPETSNGFIILC
jgi:acylphosphatase